MSIDTAPSPLKLTCPRSMRIEKYAHGSTRPPGEQNALLVHFHQAFIYRKRPSRIGRPVGPSLELSVVQKQHGGPGSIPAVCKQGACAGPRSFCSAGLWWSLATGEQRRKGSSWLRNAIGPVGARCGGLVRGIGAYCVRLHVFGCKTIHFASLQKKL